MNYRRIAAFMLALTLAFLPTFGAVSASEDGEADGYEDEAGGYILSSYSPFTDDEAAYLERRLAAASSTYDFDIFVCIVDFEDDYDVTAFADDTFDAYSKHRGTTGEDGILFFVNTLQRDWYISTGGNGEYIFGEGLIDEIAGYFIPLLKQGDWYGACNTFTDCCETVLYGASVGGFFGDDSPEYTEKAIQSCETENGRRFAQFYCSASQEELDRIEYDFYERDDAGSTEQPMPVKSRLTVSGIFGAVIAFIIAGANKNKNKSTAKRQSAVNYFAKDSMNIANSRDLFLYRNTVRTVRQTPSQSRGGSGSYHHTSSGGHSHGGHGGKF